MLSLCRWLGKPAERKPPRFPLQPAYVVSLPVAARDGTIRWRMEGTEAAGRLRAKTGTLDGLTSLSGSVQTRQQGARLRRAGERHRRPLARARGAGL
jgi:D-alanyl-D-alanine carboxypeptidase